MTSVIIGISSGLLIILLIGYLRCLEKKIIYGLILSGISFLYVGFAWANFQVLIINSIQAVVFLFLAYYGIKKSVHFLAIGYLLHGSWDMVYGLIASSSTIPPHYDWFCLSLDLAICAYLIILNKRFSVRKIIS